jgi:hypothetical protein
LEVELGALADAVIGGVDLLAILLDEADEVAAFAQAATRSVIATPGPIKWVAFSVIVVSPLLGPAATRTCTPWARAGPLWSYLQDGVHDWDAPGRRLGGD